MRTVLVAAALFVPIALWSGSGLGQQPGSEGHWYLCKGRIDGKKKTLRCCGANSEQAHNHAYANFDLDRPPTCEITNDICVVKDSGNCTK